MRASESLALSPEEVLPPPQGLTVESGPPGGEGEVVLSFPLSSGPRKHPPLTGAEEAVLAELLLSCSNAEISTRRGVSVRTVANQLATLFRKLGVHSRLEAARVAAERMSCKAPPGVRGGPPAVRAVTQVDPHVAQLSEPSDSAQKATPFRLVDRMG